MNGTRDTIIETAFLLFLKKGFKAVTLTDLEKAVGMTKGTFYYHFDSDIPEILCLSLMVEVISLYPEFKQMVSDTKISWMSKLEGVILEAKREREIRDDVDTSILAKNLLNISIGLINYIVMHQDISYALSSVRYQYEQLYSLVKAR